MARANARARAKAKSILRVPFFHNIIQNLPPLSKPVIQRFRCTGTWFLYREMYDVLTDTSPIPETSLQPFQPLQWNISQPVDRDIQVAKEKLDK